VGAWLERAVDHPAFIVFHRCMTLHLLQRSLNYTSNCVGTWLPSPPSGDAHRHLNVASPFRQYTPRSSGVSRRLHVSFGAPGSVGEPTAASPQQRLPSWHVHGRGSPHTTAISLPLTHGVSRGAVCVTSSADFPADTISDPHLAHTVPNTCTR
jgi:hypothetical protein